MVLAILQESNLTLPNDAIEEIVYKVKKMSPSIYFIDPNGVIILQIANFTLTSRLFKRQI